MKTLLTGNNNPYIVGAEGRREWNDRYMNMAKAIRNWQIAFFSAIGIIVILALVIAKIATESRVKPYVVETNHGVPYAIQEVKDLSSKDQLLVNYAVNQFITNAKTVLTDTNAEKTLLNKVYAYSGGKTALFLREYYAKHNPFEKAGEYSVSVNILNSMPLSSNTWQIMWEETKYGSVNNAVLETTHWVGQVTYKFGEIKAKYLGENPFGIYITDLTWAQNNANSEIKR